MIRQRPDGSCYCDGSECGYPLSFTPGDPEEGITGVLACLDCGASVSAVAPPPAVQTTLLTSGRPHWGDRFDDSHVLAEPDE